MDRGKRRILYMMPQDPIGEKAGNTTRCIQMLTYFQANQDKLEVIFVSLKPWPESSIKQFNRVFPSIELKLFQRSVSKKENYLQYFFQDKVFKLWKETGNGKKYISNVTPYNVQQFKAAIGKQSFDIALISYAYWGDLINYIDCKYSILDTHDFITKQYMLWNERHKQRFASLLVEELNIMKQYDEVWSYSLEEQFMFDQLLENHVRLIPISFPIHTLPVGQKYLYDVLFVANDNNHNVNSIRWFIDAVLPFLPTIRITVVGKICDAFEDHIQIDKKGLVEDLDAYYSQTKITICPMLSGTGIKIKVLESLSYGIPVVTNRRGVDGLINKSMNGCLVSDDPKVFAANVLKLLNDQQYLEEQSQLARQFFKENYSSNMEKQVMDSIFIK